MTATAAKIRAAAKEFLASLANYGDWWRGLSPARRILPALTIITIWILFAALGGIRGDHIVLGLAALALFYGGHYGAILMKFLTPVFLVGTVYDFKKFFSNALRGHIRVAEPYLFDKTLFGIQTDKGVLTPNEWFQAHTHWSLDFISGFFYLTFIVLTVSAMGWIYFYYGEKGTPRHTPEEFRQKRMLMPWAFFWLNCLGYSTYYWYPAAPPWYVAEYGLGPANMLVRPNAAGGIRFDQLFGTNFFGELYGRSQDVFGAIPSLHIAYPLIVVFFAFRFGASLRLKILMISLYLTMCFSAVYLNHHYILDLLWGSAYVFIVGGFFVFYDRFRSRRNATVRAAPGP